MTIGGLPQMAKRSKKSNVAKKGAATEWAGGLLRTRGGMVTQRRVAALAFAAAMLAGVSSQAASATRKIVGNGGATCAMWTKERQGGTPNFTWMGNRVVGYVSAANFYDEGPDFLLQGDPNAIVGGVDNYCSSHPGETVLSGAHALVQELRARAKGVK
jgi:hypothetical protein